jgi:hypothetical protein
LRKFTLFLIKTEGGGGGGGGGVAARNVQMVVGSMVRFLGTFALA